MPLYEGIGIVSEKYSVILDIGTAYTKCGFARENGPRWIIPSEIVHPHTGQSVKVWNYTSEEELYILLKEFLQALYFKYLVVNPKDRRLIVVESVLCPTTFRETLARVLFRHFEIPSLVFVPSHLMALFTLGISSAVVMDAGYSETTVIPIYEGVPILSACNAMPVGGQAIHRRIEAELMEKATVKTTGPDSKTLGAVLSEPLKESVLEDIKVRTCFVTRLERGRKIQAYESSQRIRRTTSPEELMQGPPPPPDVSYPLDGERIMTVPGSVREWAAELLFEQDGDEQSLSTLILDSLLKCSIDTRKTLAANVVVMGGTAMMPGFKHRLISEIHTLLEDPRYEKLSPLKGIKIHNPPTKENYVSWLGGAMFGATDAVLARTVTKEQYIQQQYIPDWSDQKWCEENGKSLA